MITSGAPVLGLEQALHGRERGRLVPATLCAARSPVGKIWKTQKISAPTTPTEMLTRANCSCLPESRKKAPMAASTNAPVIAAPLMLCRYCQLTQGFVSRPQNESSWTLSPAPE